MNDRRKASRSTEPTPRKGARRISEIPKSVLKDLNAGRIESANLVEGLAIDFVELAKCVDAEFGRTVARLLQPEAGYLERMKTLGDALFEFRLDQLSDLANHPSDTVRGWVVYAFAADPKIKIGPMIQTIKPFADDRHFGVREWAWLAIRRHVVAAPAEAINHLSKWSHEPKKPNLRRFASEATRPRGVWCAHIEELKTNPQPGLVVLEPLKNDESKYVRDSVANWLNDASKTRPDWVESLCARWLVESPGAETAYIAKRALRSIK